MAGVATPVYTPDQYANVDDLTLFWKAPDDSARALYLLKLASNRLRLIASDINQFFDVFNLSRTIYFNLCISDTRSL